MKGQSWIDRFVDATAHTAAPDIFRKWSAISCVASGLERRCYTRTTRAPLYPNLFVVLVAVPGIGKTIIIHTVRELLAQTQKINTSPNTMTRANLIDNLLESKKLSAEIELTHPLAAVVGEFGTLVPEHNTEFLNTLNDIWDCPRKFTAGTRSHGNQEIEKPVLNILAGTQPKFLNEIMPNQAFGMGFTSRLLLIYASEGSYVPIFGDVKSVDTRKIQSEFKMITEMRGEFKWEKEAELLTVEWHREGCPPNPKSTRLQHYNIRRIVQALKVAMCHAAAFNTMTITADIWERAKSDLLEAEETMPEIFKEMSQASSDMVIQETMEHMQMLYNRRKKPVPHDRLVHYLSQKVPVNQISYYIQTMVDGRFLELENPTKHPSLKFYKPLSITERGMADLS